MSQTNLNEILKRLDRLERNVRLGEIPDSDLVLEAILESVDVRTLQSILREIDADALGLAMVGLKTVPIAKFKAAMSKKAWKMIVDDIDCLMKRGLCASAVWESRSKVIYIVFLLWEMGEITLEDPHGTIRLEEWKRRSEAFWGKRAIRYEGAEKWRREVLGSI